jgi:hypothetical protein
MAQRRALARLSCSRMVCSAPERVVIAPQDAADLAGNVPLAGQDAGISAQPDWTVQS